MAAQVSGTLFSHPIKPWVQVWLKIVRYFFNSFSSQEKKNLKIRMQLFLLLTSIPPSASLSPLTPWNFPMNATHDFLMAESRFSN